MLRENNALKIDTKSLCMAISNMDCGQDRLATCKLRSACGVLENAIRSSIEICKEDKQRLNGVCQLVVMVKISIMRSTSHSKYTSSCTCIHDIYSMIS